MDEKQRAQKKLAEAWIPELKKQWEDLEFKLHVASVVFDADLDYDFYQAQKHLFLVTEKLREFTDGLILKK